MKTLKFDLKTQIKLSVILYLYEHKRTDQTIYYQPA
jgi:hypothetical protein